MFYRYEHYMSISHMALIVAMQDYLSLAKVWVKDYKKRKVKFKSKYER